MDEKRMMAVFCVLVVLVLLSISIDFGTFVMRVYKLESVHYPRRLASLLKIIAAVVLAIAHAIINVETGCFCCARVPRQLNVNLDPIDAIITLICFVFSWFTFAAATFCFLASAVLDNGKPSILHSAGFASFCCLGFEVVYYLLYSKNFTSSTAQVTPPNEADIDLELGQPQVTPNQLMLMSQDPVFRE